MPTEINDAQQLHAALTQSRDFNKNFASQWAWWAPGDFTRYRVTHVVAYAHEWSPFSQVHYLLVSVGGGPEAIAIGRPVNAKWNAESFLSAFGERYAGMWAGIRPVLAAFGWTSTRPDDFRYSASDATTIGEMLTETT